MDTPGILWPKFEDQEVGRRLAYIGSMNDEIIIKEELALDLIRFLKEAYPGLLHERYGLDEELDAPLVLNAICENRKCFKKGQELDLLRGANLFLEDFRSGKLGRISLEKPEEEKE